MNFLIRIFLFFQILFHFILKFFSFLSPSLKKRRDFESANKRCLSHKSFKKDGLKADIAFEVSSEGELEQIRPLLISMLKEGKRVELIFCSDSVTGQCEKIYNAYSDNVRLFRLPLISYLPLSCTHSYRAWRTSKVLVLCRYDFFPELILKSKKEKLLLVWGSLKSFERKTFVEKVFLKKVYALFDFIFCATDLDKLLFEKILTDPKLMVQDFRPYQILRRIEKREEKIAELFHAKDKALSFFRALKDKRVDVLGNYWPSDIKILKSYDVSQKKIVFIAPHQLGEKNIEELKNELIQMGHQDNFFEINSTTTSEFDKVIELSSKELVFVIVNLKGLLCELYSYSQRAYVSGGFGRSVHSLLEPAVSGNQIVCGPKVFRSTEFDLIQEIFPEMITIAESQEMVLESFEKKQAPLAEKVIAWHKNIVIMNEKAFSHFKKLLESFYA